MKKILNDLLAVIFLIFLIFVFFVPIFLPGRNLITTGVTKSDLMNFNYPLKVVYSEALKGGKHPFWTPYIANGFPLLAEGQVAAFYPLNLLLFFLFSPSLAFNLSLFIHVVLAALFTYLFVRIVLKLTQASALIAGLSFSLSGFFVVHLVHLNMLQVFAWLPLQFLLLELMIKEKKYFLSFFPLTLVLACQLLAGHPSILYKIGLILSLYLLARIFFRQKVSATDFLPLIILVLAVAFAAAIAAIQLLPTWELVKISSRAPGLTYQEATSYLFPFSHLLTLIFPWVFDVFSQTKDVLGAGDILNLWETYAYLGLIPLFLAGLSFLTKKKSQYLTIFSILTIACLILALGRTTPVFRIIWSLIPGMKFFRYQTRFMLFVEFGLSVLAAFGWSSVEEKLKPKLPRLTFISAIIIILITLDLVFTQWRIHQTADVLWWFKAPATAQFLKKNAGYFRYFSVGTSNLKYDLAKKIEIQKEAQELLPANFNLIHQVSLNYGQYALFPKTLARLNRAVKRRMVFNEENNSFTLSDDFLKLLSLQGVKYLLSDLPLNHDALNKAFEVKLEKELIHTVPLVRGNNIEVKEVPTQKIFVYENKEVLARTFLAGKIVNSGDDWQNLDISEADFAQAVYLRGDLDWQDIPEVEGSAEIISYENEKVEIKTGSPTPALLFLSDSFYPGWEAFIDGQPTQILAANLAFRAVKLPAGSHTVIFRFEPQSFKNGLLITKVSLAFFSLLSLALFAGRSLLDRYPQKRIIKV